MFVRTRTRKLKSGFSSYAYLVDNQWNPVRKKHIQKIIACLGPTDKLPHDGTIEKIIIALDNFAKRQGFSSLSCGTVIPKIAEGKNLTCCYDWGIVILTQRILKELSFTSTVKHLATKYTANLSYEALSLAITAMLVKRLIPESAISEKSTCHWYQKHVFLGLIRLKCWFLPINNDG